MKPRPGLALIGITLKWTGLLGILSGLLSTMNAVVNLYSEFGPGDDPTVGDINKLALALLLGSMFFMLAGSGLVLLSRPLVKVSDRGFRWPRALGYVLYIYSAGVLGIAVVLVRELGGNASTGIIAGLVIYCVLVAAGLLIASWGLRRFADAR